MKNNTKYFNVSPCGNYIGCHINKINDEILKWIDIHDLKTIKTGQYLNIEITPNISDLFILELPYKLMDGFSPNPNKELHVGHLSNFIIANAIKRLCFLTAIFMQNSVENISHVHKKKIIKLMHDHMYGCVEFTPTINSEIKLIEGEGSFDGTKCIKIDNLTKVCIKSDLSTSYLYEDLTLIHNFKEPILYITGKEQSSHFELLKKYCLEKFKVNYVHHIPIGHVQLNGKKVSTREGNKTYAQDLIDKVTELMGSEELAWNVISGAVLSYDPTKDKSLDITTFDNPRKNVGLYLSYTMARIHRAGIKFLDSKSVFKDPITAFVFMKAAQHLKPQSAINRLRLIAKELNLMYEGGDEYKINSSNLNDKINNDYHMKLHDLKLGMEFLGMKVITKV